MANSNAMIWYSWFKRDFSTLEFKSLNSYICVFSAGMCSIIRVQKEILTCYFDNSTNWEQFNSFSWENLIKLSILLSVNSHSGLCFSGDLWKSLHLTNSRKTIIRDAKWGHVTRGMQNTCSTNHKYLAVTRHINHLMELVKIHPWLEITSSWFRNLKTEK